MMMNDDDDNAGPSETESPIASGGDGDSEETEDLTVAPASKRHRVCGLLTFFTRPAEVQVTPGTQGGAAATQEDHRAVELVSEDEAREAAHGEEQMQTQRNTDSAQGGTVDCTETTEPKKKRQRKSAEAGPTGLAPDDMASEDDAAPAAHDENQLQPQRNTDGAQGGTVDCAETTELTCGSTDSAQGGAVDCVTAPKRKRMKRKKLTTNQRKKKRGEGQR